MSGQDFNPRLKQPTQFGVTSLRTVAEHLTCSLMLLEFVPMCSGSQQCLRTRTG